LKLAQVISKTGRKLVGFEKAGEFFPFKRSSDKETSQLLLDVITNYDHYVQEISNMNKGSGIEFSALKFLPPIPNPGRPIFCVGKNYAEHVREGARAGEQKNIPKAPIFFTKLPSIAVATNDPVYAWEVAKNMDYEAELGVVLGKKARDLEPEDVKDYIFGYTLVNDVTSRLLQNQHTQWFKGKNLDTFCPIGPYIVTRDEVEWPVKLHLDLFVNNEKRQSLDTVDMIFNISEIVSSLSKGFTLEAGDIISTGTGSGCAFGMEPPIWLKPGDIVSIRCKEIGELTNPIKSPGD
jgi:2-keto-4-pentenoate hydratase/2-oxohepta-3-ene-1,7-dioic acid hydratase in catechol pathway